MLTLNPQYLLFGLFFCAQISFGQNDTINQVDENNLKQGYWIVYGSDKPEKGYSADGKIEEGYYVDNRKEGQWIKYHKDGKTVRLKGTYVKGRPDGPYSKYYDSGGIMEEGIFINKRLFRYRGYYESGCLSKEGNENGTVTFYNNDCILKDSIQGTIKQSLIKNDRPSFIERSDCSVPFKYDPNDKTLNDTIPGQGGPSWHGGISKDGRKFINDGYNKVYNTEDEVWMDGLFKDSRLWDGKLYKYDSDGILLKIEVWKNGKYHSDGEL